MEPTILILSGILLLAASIADIKTTEVPDWITYGGMFMGVGIRAILSWNSHSWQPLAEGIIGFAILTACALFMYHTGQWGGGDAKMLMALGVLLGIEFRMSSFTVSFLLNLVIVGGIYGICWGLFTACRRRKRFIPKFRLMLDNARTYRIILYIIIVAFLALAFAMPELKFALIMLSFLLFTFFYLFIALLVVEKHLMTKKVAPKDLLEGDWIIKDIIVNKKLVVAKSRTGITRKEIKKLANRVRKVEIREGVPFIPSFFIAYILTAYLGNILLLALG